MALLDVFKKKKEEKKPEKKAGKVRVGKSVELKEDEKPEEEIVEKKEKAVHTAVEKKEFSQIAAKILKSPHVTEKAINLGQQNKYVFKVSPDANKVEVKKAIQEFYGVKVQDVNITNIPRKKRRVGGREGFRTGIKKAVVTLAEGEKIEAGI